MSEAHTKIPTAETPELETNKGPTKSDHIQAYLLDAFLWSYFMMVAHKVLYNKFILNLRYPEFSWSHPFFSTILGCAVAGLLFLPKSFSIGKRVKGIYVRDFDKSLFAAPYALLSLIFLVVTFVAGLQITEFSITEFLSDSGLRGAKRIFVALLTPNLAIFEDAMFEAIETIYMAFIATVLSLPFAFIISFLSAQNLMNTGPISSSVYYITRFFLNMTRAIEPLVWAIIFSVWVGIGPFAGMLALFLHSVASLAKLYSEQIEGINDGPIEAMTATGAHPIQIVWYGVVPQIVLPFLSFTIYRWDINVRMATVIGLVGGGGIGTMLMQYQGLAKWNEVGLLVLVIAFIVWVMDFASAKIRAAIK